MDTADPQNLIIRKFYMKDRRQVVSFWKTVFPNDPPWNDPDQIITRKRRRQRDLFLVGLNGKEIIATVLAGYDGFRGWIYHLAVHPNHRKQGIGRALMKAAETLLIAQGCIKINLQVRSGNADVVLFYEKLGYKAEDHISMGKRL